MRTFHEQQDAEAAQVTPIRLSYHGQSHYNSMVPKGWTVSLALVESDPGVMEKEAIEWAQQSAIDVIQEDNKKD